MTDRVSAFLALARARGEVALVGPLCPSLPPHLICDRLALLAVDGGLDAHPSAFHLSLGDGDSLKSAAALDVVFPQDKDQSDLALALQFLPLEVRKIELWGFLGGRLDHELAAIGEALHFVQKREVELTFHSDIRLEAHRARRLEVHIQGHFSLFSLQTAQVSIDGLCKFPLPSQQIPPLSSHLLSNEAQGLVTIDCDQPFLLYRGTA